MNETIKKGTKVGYQKGNEEFKIGFTKCNPNYNNHVLVEFDLGYSRWINVDNLDLVVQVK